MLRSGIFSRGDMGGIPEIYAVTPLACTSLRLPEPLDMVCGSTGRGHGKWARRANGYGGRLLRPGGFISRVRVMRRDDKRAMHVRGLYVFQPVALGAVSVGG